MGADEVRGLFAIDQLSAFRTIPSESSLIYPVAPLSAMMRPSTKPIRRAARAASVTSWVTATTVRPSFSARSPRIEKTRSALWVSRLPVGSSASRIGGSLASARAIGGALTLAARELVRPAVAQSGDVQALQDGLGTALNGFPAAPRKPPQRDHDILEDGELRQQKVELEDKTDAAQAEGGRFIAIECASVASLQPDPPAGRPIEQPEEVEQRRFARARGSGDGDKLAGADRQIDVLHQRRRHRAGEDTGHLFGDDDGRACGCAHGRAHKGAQAAPRMMSTGLNRAARRAGR